MILDKTGSYVNVWNKQQDGDLNETNLEKKLRNKYNYRIRKFTVQEDWNMRDHTHAEKKAHAVLIGEVEINMSQPDNKEKVRYVLEAGDILYMPAGITHDAKVLSGCVFYY